MKTILSFCVLVISIAVSGTAQSNSNSSWTEHSIKHRFITDQHSQFFLHDNKRAESEYLYAMAFTLTSTPLDRSYRISNTDSIQPVILWNPFELKTIALQTVTGLGLGALIFIPGNSNSGSREGLGEGLLILTKSVVAAFAVPSAIFFIGKWMGGNGSYIWTLLGGLGAGGISLVPNIMAGTGDQNASIIRTAVLVVAGAILGYHLSASPVFESSSSVFIKPGQEVVSPLQMKIIDCFQKNCNIFEFSIEL